MVRIKDFICYILLLYTDLKYIEDIWINYGFALNNGSVKYLNAFGNINDVIGDDERKTFTTFCLCLP